MNHPPNAPGSGTSSAPYQSLRGELEEHLSILPPGSVGSFERLDDGRIRFVFRQPEGRSHGPAMFLEFEGITWHLNLYEIGRSYGGPEEGGWGYDFGTFSKCLGVFTTPEDANAKREELREQLAAWREGRTRPGSVLSANDWPELYVEPHPGRPFPLERPRYE